MAGLPEHQVVELLRHVAWTELGVEVDGDTVAEMVQGIYSAGGSDALLGLAAINKHRDLGASVFVVGPEDRG